MDIWPKKYDLIFVEYYSGSIKNCVFSFIAGDLCQPLNCKKRELCLLEDAFTALCVSKTMLHKNRYVYTNIFPWKSPVFLNYVFVICSDEIISVSTQKVTKLGDGSGNIGSPKFSDEIYLTDDFYGSSNTK